MIEETSLSIFSSDIGVQIQHGTHVIGRKSVGACLGVAMRRRKLQNRQPEQAEMTDTRLRHGAFHWEIEAWESFIRSPLRDSNIIQAFYDHLKRTFFEDPQSLRIRLLPRRSDDASASAFLE